MSNKITARFGADVSEVESKMIAATRATKYYENAVKQVAKADAMRSAGGGGLLGSVGSKAPQLVGRIKELAGAFGAAGAAAGLVPGLGMAAIGVAAVVAGVNKIKDYYAKAAESAKEIRDMMLEAGAKAASVSFEGLSEEGKLKRLKEESAFARIAWMESMRNNKTDNEILKARAFWDEKRVAYEKQLKEVQKSRIESNAKLKKEDDAAAERDFVKMLEQGEKFANQKRAMESEVADILSELEEQRKENIKKEKEQVKELEEMRYNAIWRYATLQQKLAQAVKEGQKAQAKAQKDASTENLIALEKAKDKYRDLIDQAKELLKTKSTGRNENGRFTTESGNVIVSDADRARSDALKKRDSAFNARTKSQQISSSSVRPEKGTGKSDEAKILTEIRNLLEPKK